MSWQHRQSAALAAVDRHFGDLLFELAGGEGGQDADLLAVTGALASAARRQGDACVMLAGFAGRPPHPEDDLPPLPELPAWSEALRRSPLVGAGGDGVATPLVLDGDGRLYLLRFYRAERRLLRNVQALLASPPAELEPEERTRFAELFPAGGDKDEGQALAVLAAARSRLAVVTGGPGTGKTTTVARLLALLLHRRPGLRVAPCAPTGKAAARLGQALAGRLDELGVPEAARSGVQETRTLHRLLGYHPLRDDFRHGPGRPLPAELVVLDEASMVDLSLMDALLAALGPEAHLVLLGDQDQLASVAAGRVLADLCAAARPELGPGPGLAAAWQALGRPPLAPRQGPAGPLADAVVRLRSNYRFAEQPGLAALAQAIAEGRIDEALALLTGGEHEELGLRPFDPRGLLTPIEPHLQAVLAAEAPQAALSALDRFRLLCAERHGPRGVEACNQRVERRLAAAGLRTDRPFYRGRPVLVTANDYGTGLFNGDLGLCWPGDDGQDLVWFRDGEGSLRPLSPYRLPPHETAWATTVHKSQGTEAEEVLLVMPDRDLPLCTAELVYTAVTRARRRVRIAGDPDLLRLALGRRQARASGLAAALSGRLPDTETGVGNSSSPPAAPP